MKPIRCCVIDDEPLALQLIKGYVEQTPFLQLVDTFASASQAIKCVINNDVDLIFLDIQMTELNGIEFAKIVPERCRIIFITAFQQYALDGFKANAVDYLLKPVNYTEFLQAANKAYQWFELREGQRATSTASNDTSDDQYVIVKSEYKLIQIPVNDILYIEGLKDYVKIYVDGAAAPIMSLISMKALEANLPTSKFMRVHRSFIVQKSKIRMIERNRIIFGKQYIPISESYKNEFYKYVATHSIVASSKDD